VTGNGLRGLDEGVLCDMWGKAVLQVCREWGCRKVFYFRQCLSVAETRCGVYGMERWCWTWNGLVVSQPWNGGRLPVK